MKKGLIFLLISLIFSGIFVLSSDVLINKYVDNLSDESKVIINKNIKQVKSEIKKDDQFKKELKGIEKSFKNFLRGNSSHEELEDDTKKSFKSLEKKGKELFNEDQFNDDLKYSVKQSLKQTVLQNLILFLIMIFSFSGIFVSLHIAILKILKK